jgi:hypothetical protein
MKRYLISAVCAITAISFSTVTIGAVSTRLSDPKHSVKTINDKKVLVTKQTRTTKIGDKKIVNKGTAVNYKGKHGQQKSATLVRTTKNGKAAGGTLTTNKGMQTKVIRTHKGATVTRQKI